MSGTAIRLVFVKELRETLRDRRTLAVMILLPLVIYPLISLMAARTLADRATQAEARPSRVAVTGAPLPREELRRFLGGDPKRFLLAEDGHENDVLAGRIDALVLAAPPETGKPGLEPTKATVLYDETSDRSRQARDRLEESVGALLPDGCAPRFRVADRNVAAREKVGGFVLSKVLPSFLLLMVLLGAIYPAIDVTAGERERGTLETTLTAPIDTVDLMTGKVLAAATVASLTGLLNLAAMSLTVAQGIHIAAAGQALAIPWTRALLTLLVVLPASVLFAAMLVAVGSLARSFKEAQTLLTPVYLVFIMPVVVASFVETRLTGMTALLPVMNLALLIRDIVAGTAGVTGTVLVLLSTGVYIAAALALAARLYDPERLLAAEDARPWWRRGPTTAPAGPPVTAGAALALFALSFVFTFFSSQSVQSRSVMTGLLLSEWVGMFGLVWAYARVNGRGLAEIIGWRAPRPRAVAGAILVGLSAWAVLGVLAEWFLRPPRELEEALRRMVSADSGRSAVLTLALMSLTPAICEETLFRGAILRGLGTRLKPAAALVVTSLLFGLAHFDPWRLLPTSILGLLFGWLTLASGSIVPAMIAHLLNNGSLIVLARLGADQGASHATRGAQAAFLAAAAAVLTGGVLLVRGSARPDDEGRR